jgi:mRNA-degrading endonuclease RelE of RelBE toxin-antitoxin system
MTQWVDKWTRSARKERDRIPVSCRGRVLEAIKLYCETGFGDVDTIKPFVGEYRLRVGVYRIRFSLDSARGEFIILHVATRGGAYQDR